MALKEEEAAVYDRQLRVWGVEVQRKLTAARVLIVGFGQLASEVAKNITLAGVGNLTLLDDTPASRHLGRNFLIAPPVDGLTSAEAAAKALQEMNPLVNVTAAPGSTADLAAAAAAAAAEGGSTQGLVQQQDLVIGVGLPLLQAQSLDAACRVCGVKFMAAAAAGAAGWFFLDLGDHSFLPKDAKVPQTLTYPPLEAALAPAAAAQAAGISTHPLYFVLQACWAAEQQLQRPLTAADQAVLQEQLDKAAGGGPQANAAGQLLSWMWHGEATPVCAVLGGIMANNVVAAVSGASAPLSNLLYYSLADGRAIVEQHPGPTAAAAAGGKGASQQQQQQGALVDVVALDD